MATIPNSQKTFSVNEGVNTVYGGSASMKALSQWYTMQDITDTVRPYKVYTALLTQSGGDSIGTKNNGSLSIGFTYYISLIEDETPGDFMNVGAPSNDVGTYFVATGTEPNSWGKTTLEWNAGTPVVTVLENTIGNVWFTYDGVGQYTMESTDLFTDFKTWFAKPIYSAGLDQGYMYYDTSDRLVIISEETNVTADSILTNGASIEVRVYN